MSKLCPLTGDACMQHGCEWYIQIQGTNPNTGQPVNEFGCTMRWLPILLVENSQQQRQTGAAVESFRNEMVHQGMETQSKIYQALTNEEKKKLS